MYIALSTDVHNLVEKLNNNYQKVCLSQPFPSTVPPVETRRCGVGEVAKTKDTRGGRACSSPQTVLAVTRTSILTDGQPQWIHASRVKTSPTKPPKASDQVDDDSGEPALGFNTPTHTQSLINTQRLKEQQQGTQTSSRNRKPEVPHDV